MWPIKFVKGAVPGKRSAPDTSDEAKQNKRKQYERDRRTDCSFSASWQEKREWLFAHSIHEKFYFTDIYCMRSSNNFLKCFGGRKCCFLKRYV